MGNKESSHASTFSRGQGAASDIRDVLASLPGSQPKNRTGRKVTAQKITTASSTGILALQEHGLKEVPETIFKLEKLRTLNLESNSLKVLPVAICSLTKLKTLRLDSNKLEGTPDLSSLVALTSLSIARNLLKGVAAVGPLPKSLTKFHLGGNQLGGLPTATLFGLPALQELDLSNNSIVTLPTLTAELFPCLEELVVDKNGLRTLGDEVAGLPKLKKLSARSNLIGVSDPVSGEQAISKSLLADSTVEILDLAGNHLDKVDFMNMGGVDTFLSRRERNKNKNLQGGALLDTSVCGLD